MAYKLLLVSASARRGEPAKSDLVFNLDVQQLPDFSKTEIWKDNVGSPLRDRLMIDWLFSHSSAQDQLKLMITQINRKIQLLLPQQSQDQPPSFLHPSPLTLANSGAALVGADEAQSLHEKPPSHTGNAQLLVGITCRSGVHHSPCFVEKLRDMYQRDRAYNKLLIIQTQHWDISPKSHGKKKHFVWQRTKIPTKYIRDMEVLTNARVWVSLDAPESLVCEQAFLQDQYCSVIPGESCVVDFESGTFFDKVKRKSFLIRSTSIQHALLKGKQPPVNCRFVGDEAYKKAVKRYDAAGILFYSVHPITGEAVFLLGHMTYSCQSWCDFGGLRNWKRERARQTAARECYEETLGIFGGATVLQHQLEDYKTNNVFKVVNEAYYYVSHFLRVPFKDYPGIFEAEASLPCHTGRLEIDEMRWFSLAAMRKCVKMALDNQVSFAINHINKDGTASSVTNRLRVEFVHTMCIADKLGILNSIEYITKQLHSNSLPPPPRPVSYPKPRGAPKDTLTQVSQSMQPVSTNSNSVPHSRTGAPTDGQDKPSLEANPSLSYKMATSNIDSLSDSVRTLDCFEDRCTHSLDKAIDPMDHREHSLEASIGCEKCKELRDIQSLLSESTHSENNDDMVTRSRMWSFEEFLSSLLPEQKDKQHEVTDICSQNHEEATPLSFNQSIVRHRKGKNSSDKTRDSSRSNGSGGKKKRKSSLAAMYNGSVVLYYGMGAGSFGQ